jgi:hypothetical protein
LTESNKGVDIVSGAVHTNSQVNVLSAELSAKFEMDVAGASVGKTSEKLVAHKTLAEQQISVVSSTRSF